MAPAAARFSEQLRLCCSTRRQGVLMTPSRAREYQLINSCKACWCMLHAWIYRENNTRDRSSERDIRCRSICQHHWGPLTGHSVAPLHALRVAATAVWAPAPSFGARGRETARRREEAPSRASPVSNQKRTEGRTPTAVKGRPKDARHRANCFRPQRPPSNQAVEGEQG